MKNELIYNLGKKIGLSKQDIDNTLVNSISNKKSVSISYRSDCYKNGTRYGTVSISDI